MIRQPLLLELAGHQENQVFPTYRIRPDIYLAYERLFGVIPFHSPSFFFRFPNYFQAWQYFTASTGW
jgi:hypothetical protein